MILHRGAHRIGASNWSNNNKGNQFGGGILAGRLWRAARRKALLGIPVRESICA
jgi:hypothetical protein